MSQAILNRKGNTEIEISVTLEPNDYQPAAKAELKKIASTLKIKGFRPGKVPASYVKKMYGKNVLIDTLTKSVDSKLNDLIQEEKLEIFGQLQQLEGPEFEQLSLDKGETYVFKYEGGLMPSIEKPELKGLKDVSRYTVELSDDEVQEKLDNARKQHADFTNVGALENEGDLATLVLTDKDLDKEHVSKKVVEAEEAPEADKDPRKKFFLRLEDLEEKTREKVSGKKLASKVKLKAKDFTEDFNGEIAKEVAEETKEFTIKKISRRSTPEFNEETFKKIFGEETEVKTLEDAKKEFTSRFAENSQKNLDDFALEQLIDKLIETNEIEVPENAIVQRLKQAKQEEQEQAKKDGKEAPNQPLTKADEYGLTRRLRWIALRNSLMKTYEVELKEEDIETGLNRVYIQQMSSMGIDPEMYRAQFYGMFKENYLKNREQAMQLSDELINGKIIVKLEEEKLLAKRNTLTEAKFNETVSSYNEGINGVIDELKAQPLT